MQHDDNILSEFIINVPHPFTLILNIPTVLFLFLLVLHHICLLFPLLSLHHMLYCDIIHKQLFFK